MKTFNYAPASPIKDQLTMLAVSAGMIVVPLIYPFGLRIGRLRILGPTATTVLFIFIVSRNLQTSFHQTS